MERGVGDALEQLGVVFGSADVAPVDVIGGRIEVVVAQRGQPREHGVDFALLGDEGLKLSDPLILYYIILLLKNFSLKCFFK